MAMAIGISIGIGSDAISAAIGIRTSSWYHY
jgi:hypothetical protein